MQLADSKLGTFQGLGRFLPFIQPAGGGINNDALGAPEVLNQIFTTIFGFLTIVGGLAFLLYFLIGGLNWITAGGDKTKVDTAKKFMTNGAIGMIIMVAAYAIVWVVGSILGLDILNPGNLIRTSFTPI